MKKDIRCDIFCSRIFFRVLSFSFLLKIIIKISSRYHDIFIYTPLPPTFYSKTGVYMGKHLFSYFCSKTKIVISR